MNTKKIETKSLNALRNLIDESNIIDSYISENDKTPSWDGQLFVYNSPIFSNTNLLGVVSVQIKGHQLKKQKIVAKHASFNVKRIDLENYMRNEPIVYFVILVSDNKTSIIYYKILLPLDIKNELNSFKKNEKSKSITFNKMEDYHHLERILQNFIHHKRLQNSANIDKLDSKKVIEISNNYQGAIISNHKELEKDIARDGLYFYTEIEGNVLIPLFKAMDIKQIVKKKANIHAGGNTYYYEYIIEKKNSSHIVIIENCLTFDFEKKRFSYKLKGNLFERIHSLNFMLDLLDSKQIYFNDVALKLDDFPFDVSAARKDFNELLVKFKYELSLFQKRGIVPLFSLDNLSVSDQNNYSTIVKLFAGDTSVLRQSGIVEIEIGDFYYLLFVDVSADKMDVINLFSPEILKFEFTLSDIDKDDVVITSIFFTLTTEMFNCVNFDISIILNSISNTKIDYTHENNLIAINSFLIHLIQAYDISGKKELFQISVLIIKNLDDQVSSLKEEIFQFIFINYYQLKARVSSLELQDYKILGNASFDELNKKFAVATIIKDKEGALKMWNKLSISEKDKLKEFPIYTLYKSL
ncbi:hypothetical protein [Enterococcus larvae]|uniref:hypothetical protein n=1 Tax=Enterococcus larvae TaxID=2794352 RepID=UPI003F35E0C6